MENYLNVMDVDLKSLYGIVNKKKNKLDPKYSKKDLAYP